LVEKAQEEEADAKAILDIKAKKEATNKKIEEHKKEA